MGATYKAVQWNGNKIVYDLYVIAALTAFIGVFMAIGLMAHASGHQADPVVLIIRALGSAAFLMLTIVLMIGPLSRLNRRFLPMLYNRRHLGVLTFLVASAHFGLSLFWYHGGGTLNPFVSLLVSNPLYSSIPGFPFEAFGVAAFVFLLLLAVTSHDFWLNNLSAPLWKALHMLVYPAYALLVLHVAFGALMTEKSPAYPVLMVVALALVAGLHIHAGLREWRRDSGMKGLKASDGWIDVCDPADIPDGRAVIAPLPSGDRVAVFRKGARLHAIENACRHQNGPLGEGCLKDGLVTCPWHGWQYRLEDGVSPPPYAERVATYDVSQSSAGRILIRVKKNPLGQAGAFVDLGAST
ncbi:MAG: ferric reductase-like transmembrane domain-containing protein [Parvularculaceae bacterium]|nr:ferric reductase-like transmembrane domain-containing protein [Parvularculaceae bacterium]